MLKLEITSSNYNRVINDNPKVLLKFGAIWCGPCHMLEATLSGLLADDTSVLVGSVDVDKEPVLAEEFSVRGLPKLILFERGVMVREKSGNMSLSQLRDFLEL